MKIFVFMLLLANIVCWVWQLNFFPHNAMQVDLSEESFLQAPSKLVMLNEVSTLPRTLPVNTVASNLESAEQAVSAELLAEEGANDSEGAEPVATPIETAVFESWCAVTGVLDRMEVAERLLSDWKNVGGVGEIVSDKEAVSSTWWVHLPPFPDEAAARLVLTELQRKKIDSYYMRTGELVGGISLGVFSREESARQVQAELREKGYLAEVREIERMEDRSRLYLILENGGIENNQSASQVLAEFDSIHADEIPCK